MFRRKIPGKGVLLSIAVGLCAVMAPSAQANWLVSHLKQTHEPDAVLGVNSHMETSFIVYEAFEILCAEATADPVAPPLLLAKSTVADGYIDFQKCETWTTTFGSKMKLSACRPVEPILFGGLILVVLHPLEGQNYLAFESESTDPVVSIVFNEITCGLGDWGIKGPLVFECGYLQPAGTFVGLDCENLQAAQLLRPASKSLFPGNTSTFNGILSAKVMGPALYAGLPWGGHV
jgi:hypothetical protein